MMQRRLVPGAVPMRINGRAFRIVGNPDDEYFSNFARSGQYTDDITPFLARRVARDAACLDVGANLGLTSLFLTTLGRRVQVVAFEPAPSAVGFLRANLAMNRRGQRVRCEPVAVSASIGSVSFMEMPEHLSGSYIADHSEPHPNAAGLTPVAVPTVTLDAYVAEHGLDRVDVLKIDVEGHELAVLEGASSMLARFRPTTVMEFNLWAIVHLQRTDPQTFLDTVFEIFPVVSYLDKSGGKPIELRDRPDARRAFVDGCAERGFVDNLVCEFEAG